MADGSRHEISYVAESVWGTTPNTPTLQKLRNTSVSLGLSKDTFLSEEIRADRQHFDMRQGAYKVQGDIGFELSYNTFDDILAGVMCSAWDTDVLKAGVTRKSFTFERHFGDILDYPYHLFTGCEVDKVQLTFNANSIIKGTASILGKDLALSAAAVGSLYTDPTTTHVFDSFTGSIEEGGSSIAVVTELNMTIENGMAHRHVVGSKYSLQHSAGWSNVSGTATLYFENSTYLNKFINETESSLEVVLTDLDGNSLTILVPRIKYTGAPVDVKGIGPIMIAMPWQGLLYTDSDTNIQFTRNAA